jgi:membrane-associated phospholipid phosphatase
MKELPVTKALGITLFISIFFYCYFWVMNRPGAVPYLMPVTPIDTLVPFSIYSLPIYLSLWVYASLAPGLLYSLRSLLLYGAWIALMCLVCLAIFWAFPTCTPRGEIDLAVYPAMAFLRVDTARNACPSLHVASAVFTAAWLALLLRRLNAPAIVRGLNLAYCPLIIWSTLAVRQHVFLDTVAGAFVGAVFAALSIRSIERRIPIDEI